MNPSVLTHLRTGLRSPTLITAEIALIAVASVLGASLPQAGTATGAELAGLRESGPLLGAVVRILALDHVFRSAWFLAAVGLAAISLLLVIVGQIRRVRLTWSKPLTEEHFQTVPFRADFERPVSRASPNVAIEKSLHVWTENRFGLLGSPLLHVGVLLVMVAGALRALFAVDAVVDLIEGETLPPTVGAWSAQWKGVLAHPLRLTQPVTLSAVKAAHYEAGDLRELELHLSLQRERGESEARVAVNKSLEVSGIRLFPGSEFGPAAMVEWTRDGVPAKRDAALLSGRAKGEFEGSLAGPGELVAHLRAKMDNEASRPASVELHVMKGSVLVYAGAVKVGETLLFPGGTKLTLCGTPLWARLRGSRDPSLWFAYAGLILVVAGAVVIFGFVKLDVCVAVTSAGDRERVSVALKAQRLAPLFRERFEEIVRAEKGADVRTASLPQVQAEVKIFGSGSQLRSRIAACFLFPLFLFGLTSCNGFSKGQARELVERYNRVVSEAYRRGDVKLIDPVVGANEGRKIAGLIGVRLDMGITLDAKLLALDVIQVEKSKTELRINTKEQWQYLDRKIGSGMQVGEESRDSYEMLYVFKKTDGEWRVDEILFSAPPQVGRKTSLWAVAPRTAHSIAGQPEPTGGGEP